MATSRSSKDSPASALFSAIPPACSRSLSSPWIASPVHFRSSGSSSRQRSISALLRRGCSHWKKDAAWPKASGSSMLSLTAWLQASTQARCLGGHPNSADVRDFCSRRADGVSARFRGPVPHGLVAKVFDDGWLGPCEDKGCRDAQPRATERVQPGLDSNETRKLERILSPSRNGPRVAGPVSGVQQSGVDRFVTSILKLSTRSKQTAVPMSDI